MGEAHATACTRKNKATITKMAKRTRATSSTGAASESRKDASECSELGLSREKPIFGLVNDGS